jgi:hypothetical protein
MSIEQPLGGSVGGNANTITDRQLFDHANADPTPTPSPAPSQPSQSPQSTGGATGAPPPSTRPDLQQPGQQPGQPRTPEGKFAPKPQGQPQQQRQPEDHRVPLRELLAERDARQRLEAHAQELTRAVMELQQRTDPNRQQTQQQPETIFDNPDQYLNSRVMDPLRQEGQRYMAQVKDGLSREFANTQFTAQVVDAALGAMAQFRHTPQGNFVFQQIMNSGHPYGELVKWHRQQIAYSAIGADPQAWLTKKQQEWLDDPNAQRQMLERIRARQANGNGGNGARAPNVQLPPSLSSVASTASRTEAPGDLTSQSLWSFANR